MHPIAPIAILSLAAALPALAQDSDRILVQEGESSLYVECKIASLSAKKVVVTIEDEGKGRRKEYDGEAVLEVTIAPDRKTAEFVQAEDAFNNGRYKEAIGLWGKAVQSAGRDDVLRQVAHYWMGVTAYNGRDFDAAIRTLEEHARTFGESWYLDQVYRTLYRAYGGKGDAGGALRALNDFGNAGRSVGRSDWGKLAKIYQGDLQESEGKHEDALRIYGPLSRERGSVGTEASLGMFRCLSKTGKYAEAKSRADDMIRDGRRRWGDRAMVGAFNALGDYYFHQSKELREALLAYLRGITEFESNATIGTEEHATSLAMSALLFAEVGAKEGGADKETYIERAVTLHGELESRYPAYDRDRKIKNRITELRRSR